MKPRKAAYVVHRWLALIVSLQLLAWSVGGLVFSLLDIKAVRAERGMAEHHPPPLPSAERLAPLSVIGDALSAANIDRNKVMSLTLKNAGGGPIWIASDSDGVAILTFDPVSGAPLPRLSPDGAMAAAARDRRLATRGVSAELIEADPPLEYRGKPLPVYRVELEGEERLTIYIHALTGEVMARRNRAWRVFDFFWMLHIMDYRERESFNHWLLTGASALAVFTAASGLVLWGWRLAPRSTAARSHQPPSPRP
jgi:uncharacterized iron-regulated membrane protein